MGNIISLPDNLKRKPRDIKPYIIAIEGPNGVGKTTLCGSLNRMEGFEYRLGVPPEWMEYNMKKRMIFHASWMASALYFMSGVMEVKRDIKNLDKKFIIMERSIWSTLAVHWMKDFSRVGPLLNIMKEGHEFLPIPDLTIVLKADYDTCQNRINKKLDESKDFDKDLPREFLREMEFYDWLNNQLPNIEIIDTTNLSLEKIEKLVLNAIRNKTKEEGLV